MPSFKPAVPESVTYDSSYSNFTMIAGPVRVLASFLSPVIPKDICRTSIPLTYLTVYAESMDGAAHEIQFYADLDASWVAYESNATVQWDLYQGTQSINGTANGTSSIFSWSVSLVEDCLQLTCIGYMSCNNNISLEKKDKCPYGAIFLGRQVLVLQQASPLMADSLSTIDTVSSPSIIWVMSSTRTIVAMVAKIPPLLSPMALDLRRRHQYYIHLVQFSSLLWDISTPVGLSLWILGGKLVMAIFTNWSISTTTTSTTLQHWLMTSINNSEPTSIIIMQAIWHMSIAMQHPTAHHRIMAIKVTRIMTEWINTDNNIYSIQKTDLVS